MFSNGMAYGRWGDGRRTAIFIPGGPGNEIPKGIGLRIMMRQSAALVDAGFTVWQVTRKQNMPSGHSIEDMARDYAELIDIEFGGNVELVVGTSYGGIIAQYMAAQHADRFEHIVVVAAACDISADGKELDHSFAKLMSEGEKTEAGTVLMKGLFPRVPFGWMARFGGALMGRMMSGSHDHYARDVLVEGEAEVAFDSRAVLPTIEVPVLLIAGDEDPYFPMNLIEETAGLIRDCTLKVYKGKGHMGAASDRRLMVDIMEFLGGAAS
jgi:pimeloyl-ACP methyl ester carboxylesterase